MEILEEYPLTTASIVKSSTTETGIPMDVEFPFLGSSLLWGKLSYNNYKNTMEAISSEKFVSTYSKVNKILKLEFSKKVITSKFENKLTKFSKYYSEEDKKEILNRFYSNIDWIFDLSFDKIDILLTESPSLFFKLSGKSEYYLNLEIFVNSDNTAYSLYHKRELINQDILNTELAYNNLLTELEFNDQVITKTEGSNVKSDNEVFELVTY